MSDLKTAQTSEHCFIYLFSNGQCLIRNRQDILLRYSLKYWERVSQGFHCEVLPSYIYTKFKQNLKNINKISFTKNRHKDLCPLYRLGEEDFLGAATHTLPILKNYVHLTRVACGFLSKTSTNMFPTIYRNMVSAVKTGTACCYQNIPLNSVYNNEWLW